MEQILLEGVNADLQGCGGDLLEAAGRASFAEIRVALEGSAGENVVRDSTREEWIRTVLGC